MQRHFLIKTTRRCNFIPIRGFPTLREKANPAQPNDLYEPRFEVKRHYPDLALINIKLQSYDFQPLEKFQHYIHWAAKKFKFDVVESYPMAHKAERVKEYKSGSTMTIAEYDLNTYFRVLRIGPVPAIQLPIFVMLIQANAPVGTKIIMKEYESADEIERYIPDPQLEDFKETLKNLDDPVVRKSLGWEA